MLSLRDLTGQLAEGRLAASATLSRQGQAAAISGEGSLDEAFKRIESDIAQQIAERKK